MKRPVPGLGKRVGGAERSAATVCSAPSSAREETIMILAPAAARDDPRDRLEAAGAGHFKVEQDDVDAAFAERFSNRKRMLR